MKECAARIRVPARLPDVRAFGYERILDSGASPALAHASRPASVGRVTKAPRSDPWPGAAAVASGQARSRVGLEAARASVSPGAGSTDTAGAARDPLAAARALADQGALTEARTLVEEALLSPTADAFHLLGMICQEEGRFEEAERCLTRAIYLDSEHYASLVNMALLR